MANERLARNWLASSQVIEAELFLFLFRDSGRVVSLYIIVTESDLAHQLSIRRYLCDAYVLVKIISCPPLLRRVA